MLVNAVVCMYHIHVLSLGANRSSPRRRLQRYPMTNDDSRMLQQLHVTSPVRRSPRIAKNYSPKKVQYFSVLFYMLNLFQCLIYTLFTSKLFQVVLGITAQTR